MQTQHDFIIFEPEKNTSVLKISDDNLNCGVVKSFGSGYYDNGLYVTQIKVKEGDKIVYTNHIQIEVDGKKIYITRGRDVILVDSKT